MLRERLGHWCSPGAMDIPEIDAALVITLVSQGLAYDPAELYRIKLKELAALEGLTPERAQKIYDSITASQKRDAWRLLYGLKIPLVGEMEAQALARGFTSVDAVFAAGVAQLVRQAGISEAMAQSLTRWYADSTNRKLVKQLGKAGVNFDFLK
jgi:DNA ligase (NAD+)